MYIKKNIIQICACQCVYIEEVAVEAFERRQRMLGGALAFVVLVSCTTEFIKNNGRRRS